MEVEEACGLEEDGLLDGLVVVVEEVEGLVEAPEGQVFGRGQVGGLQPALPDAELGGRDVEAVGDHREQRRLDLRPDPGVLGEAPKGGSDAEALPQRLA